MASPALPGSDPFADPVHNGHDNDSMDAWTLNVGRDASLTLATDSLIILGMSIAWMLG